MRRLPRETRDRILEMIHLNGNTPSDAIMNVLLNNLEFDPIAAKKQAARRYMGQLMRSARDNSGARRVFLDKRSGNVVDIETCTNRAMVVAVKDTLDANIKGNVRSIKKAARRVAELDGQLSMFDASLYSVNF